MNALGKGLATNEKLQQLYLKNNKFEEDGLEELIKSFSENSNLALRQLEFSQNRIND